MILEVYNGLSNKSNSNHLASVYSFTASIPKN